MKNKINYKKEYFTAINALEHKKNFLSRSLRLNNKLFDIIDDLKSLGWIKLIAGIFIGLIFGVMFGVTWVG